MAAIVTQLRSVYYRALILLLFPFVFLITYFDHVAPDWRSGFVTGFKASVAFSAVSSVVLLGFFAAIALV
jgi:hypothetical protein